MWAPLYLKGTKRREEHLCHFKAHLQKVSRLLGEFGAYVLKVLLVELAVEVASHLILIEGPVLAERTHKLDPATGGKRGVEALMVPWNSAAVSPNPAPSPKTGFAHGPLKCSPRRGQAGTSGVGSRKGRKSAGCSYCNVGDREELFLPTGRRLKPAEA